MAESSRKDLELFTCPVCLDLLREPVTIPCGHSYCMGCIKDCWAQEDEKGLYSCPQCRQSFTPRPALNKNNIFAELVEQMRRTANQAASPADKYAQPGQAECDVCTEKKLKAVKSCLVCLVSYCESHFKVHNLMNPGRKHKVVDATTDLQEKICSRHEKALEIFCKTDQSCICYLCTMDEHSGHKTVSAAAERADKQKQLVETQKKLQQRIQEREMELKDLRDTVAMFKSSAQAAVEDCEKMFTELIQCIDRRRSEVKGLIEAQRQAEVTQAEELLKQLEEEIAEMKQTDAELDLLPHTEDHIHFLKRFCATAEYNDLPNIMANQRFSFENVIKSVSTLKQQVEELCKQEVTDISKEVTRIRTVLPSDPKTKEDFQLYSCHFTLDPNTAFKILLLCDGNKKVEVDNSPIVMAIGADHPERFQSAWQVLSKESVSGRCYWEVVWNGAGISIAMSYKGINRKGSQDSVFGRNDQSWCLEYAKKTVSFWHNNEQTPLSVTATCPYKVGVYVDYRGGRLSFFSVSNAAVTLLHRVQTTFTDPLYPGFRMLSHQTSAVIL